MKNMSTLTEKSKHIAVCTCLIALLLSGAQAADFQARCQSPDVIKCVGFDSPSDIEGRYGDPHGIFTGATTPQLDSTSKASGASSLKFAIPGNTGADTSGVYFTNFAEDLSIQFGGGANFFVQWRQRFSPGFLSTDFSGNRSSSAPVISRDAHVVATRPDIVIHPALLLRLSLRMVIFVTFLKCTILAQARLLMALMKHLTSAWGPTTLSCRMRGQSLIASTRKGKLTHQRTSRPQAIASVMSRENG
jgi:hypothetical protein